MEQETVSRIKNNPKYKELVAKRSLFAWVLSILICLIYYGFILVIAFHRDWLGTPLSRESVITWGIPVGVGVILSSFLLTGLYVWRANTQFDRLTREIKEEAR